MPRKLHLADPFRASLPQRGPPGPENRTNSPRIIWPMDERDVVRVLLVDDHELVRRGMKTMLESEGDIEVVGEASDGTGVLELIGDKLPDVVLIDVIMPNKDGIEATREIKATFPHTGVVVLSG